LKRFFPSIVSLIFLQTGIAQSTILQERTINFDAGWQFSKGDFLPMVSGFPGPKKRFNLMLDV
jgi:hypothetical protein